MADIEEHYKMLHPTDKSFNKKNLTNFKVKFDNLRTLFLKKEYSVESKNKKEYSSVSGCVDIYLAQVDDQEKQIRGKLLGNHDELIDQDGKLNNIKKLGIEANDNMRNAN